MWPFVHFADMLDPQSPQGKEIVSQIRRVSPALIRSFVAGSSSVPCVFREGAASAPSDPLVLPPGDLLEVTEARPAGGYALAPGLAAVVSPLAADPPAQQGSPGADLVGVGGGGLPRLSPPMLIASWRP